MTPTTPAELVDTIRTMVHEIYAEGDALVSHMPMAFVVDPTNKLSIIALAEFGDEKSKNWLRHAFEGFARGGAQCLGMIFEAWCTSINPDGKFPAGRIADLPPDDRKEMLIIHAVSPTSDMYDSYLITRGRDKATLTPFDADNVATHQSRWLDDLPWQTPAQAAAASN